EGDFGVLVLFKPCLTGEEPPDLLQYRKANDAFPQETTLDQFYDESQWESYRRLGLFAVDTAFHGIGPGQYITAVDGVTTFDAPNLFGELLTRWWPTPEDMRKRFLEQTASFNSFQVRLRQSGLTALMEEILLPNELIPADSPEASSQLVQTILMTTEMIQVMEDTFVSLRLDLDTDHPMNSGWINQFRRWTCTRDLRSWWPVLQPIYSLEFQRFANRTLGLEPYSLNSLTLESVDSSRGQILRDWNLQAWLSDAQAANTALHGFVGRHFGHEPQAVQKQFLTSADLLMSIAITIHDTPLHIALAFLHLDNTAGAVATSGSNQLPLKTAIVYLPPMYSGTGLERELIRLIPRLPSACFAICPENVAEPKPEIAGQPDILAPRRIVAGQQAAESSSRQRYVEQPTIGQVRQVEALLGRRSVETTMQQLSIGVPSELIRTLNQAK
ncbi:MAG: hypothetical protein KDA85_13840, partial [Planctomycetaceae bacterium]|nr:hypothetical protein [Planctomycetaceae bacterium]